MPKTGGDPFFPENRDCAVTGPVRLKFDSISYIKRRKSGIVALKTI